MLQRQERASIIMIVLLGIILVAAVMAVVINTGHQLNRGQHLQDAADATAIAAATDGARLMNTTAMNNIDISMKLSSINYLDSIPQATRLTLNEDPPMYESLQNQLNTLPIVAINSQLNALAFTEFNEMLEEMDIDITQLLEIHELFENQYDVAEDTHYQAPSGGVGRLWQAMYALSAMSEANMENIGDTMQYSAQVAARENLPTNSNHASGFIMPLTPEIPVQRGSFTDFERPQRYGLLPTAIDDLTYNRGPYDTIFGWRSLLTRTFNCQSRTYSTNTLQGGSGQSRLSGGRNRSSTRTITTGCETEVYGYRTHGTQRWMNRHIGHWASNVMQYSRFHRFANQLATTKMQYLWDDLEVQTIMEPEWVIDFNEAVAIYEAGDPPIRETAYFRMQIKSIHPMGTSQFLSAGTYAKTRRGHDGRAPNPWIQRISGWYDIRADGLVQQGNYSWVDSYSYEDYFDEDLGLEPILDENGQAIPQTIYIYIVYMFAGANIGEDVEIPNPYAGFNKFAADAPAPINLNHGLVTRDESSRLQYLNYLAATRRSDGVPMMNEQFSGGKPFDNIVRVAQSRIINNHSFDLWTPMWHAQLAPVSEFETFVTNAVNEDMPDTPNLDETSTRNLLDYLSKVTPMADHMRH